MISPEFANDWPFLDLSLSFIFYNVNDIIFYRFAEVINRL